MSRTFRLRFVVIRLCARGTVRGRAARRLPPDAGVSLVETIVAALVLTVGSIGLASVFVYGVQSTSNSPNELIATQKAAEAIESVFSARDSQALAWAQIRNVNEEDEENVGIFLTGPRPLHGSGPDGIINTTDDDEETIESIAMPGPDGTFGTEDDEVYELDGFTREIAITPLTSVLREITVTVIYPVGAIERTYTLRALISAWA